MFYPPLNWLQIYYRPLINIYANSLIFSIDLFHLWIEVIK